MTLPDHDGPGPMTPGQARRDLITSTAIETLAGRGMRGLTHRAVDQAAGLPAGSTSYYFRTREALLQATVERLADRFLRKPTQMINFGEVSDSVSRECKKAWSKGIKEGHGDTLKDDIAGCSKDAVTWKASVIKPICEKFRCSDAFRLG